jgi:hypothetical protein
MKKMLVLVLLVLMFMVSPKVVANSDVESFQIDGYTVNQLQKSRPQVYLYYDIVGYDANDNAIKKYVASTLEFEVGDLMQVTQEKIFDKNVHVFVIDGKLDNSWHEGVK